MLLSLGARAKQYVYDGNCTHSVRGGVTLFSPTAPKPALDLRLIQCGDRLPNISFASQPAGSAAWKNASCADKVVLANLLYAATHAYSFSFYLEPKNITIASSWCRVHAMRHALSAQPRPAGAFLAVIPSVLRLTFSIKPCCTLTWTHTCAPSSS